MIWTAVACLNQFVNSVVWSNDAINRAPVWCDISTRVTIGAAVGIPLSSFCIIRRLHSISRVQVVAVTHYEKRRAILVDTLICVLLPMIEMALAYIVQGHRFDIFEEVGCFPGVYNTALAYLLISAWPVAIGLLSAVYCALTLRSFLARRTQFTQFLSSNTSLTLSRYIRLMALASTEMLLTTPLASLQMVIGLTGQPLEPWRSWADTHYNFSRVILVSSVNWRNSGLPAVSLEITRWSAPLCAFVFFLFFGFAEESRRNYRRAIDFVLTACKIKRKESSQPARPGLRQLSLPTVISSQSSLPGYPSPPPQYFSSKSPSTTIDMKSPTNSCSGFEKLPDSPLATSPSSIC